MYDFHISLTWWKPTRAKRTVKQLKSMYDFHISLTWWKPTRDKRTVKQFKSMYDLNISLTDVKAFKIPFRQNHQIDAFF